MMGLFLDEIILGRTIDLGAHVFTDEAINRFRVQFAPVPMHVNGSSTLFGKPVAVGFHICCGWMSCFVAANTKARAWLAGNGMKLPEIGPSPGLENLRWPHPVEGADVVTYTVTATEKRTLNSKPGWGIVTAYSTGKNQHGVEVMNFVSRILVATR
jgi:acyl dehydratase